VKKRLLVGLLCGAGVSTPIWAQTSVTMYGVLDAGIQVSKFGNGTQTSLASGIADGSRLGFKGAEDLGGGYKTIFNLEARIELDTGANSNGYPVANVGQALTNGVSPTVSAALIGQGVPAATANATAAAILAGLNATIGLPPKIVNANNGLFDRTSMVGLVTPVGAFLLGRQYTPGYEIVAISDPFERGTAAGWGTITGGTGDLLTPGVALRANQTLQYRVQLPSGFGGAAMYGFKDTGSANVSKRFWGVNAKYTANGFEAGIGYNTEEDQLGNKSLTSTVIGGSYTTGPMKFFAGYLRMKNDHSWLVPQLAATTSFGALAPTIAAIVGENAKIDGDSYTLGMHYTIGNGRVMGTVAHTNDKLATNADTTLYGLGYDYNMSKRTDLYAIMAHATNENGAQYGLGGAGYGGGFTSQPGQSASALQLGMRHKF